MRFVVLVCGCLWGDPFDRYSDAEEWADRFVACEYRIRRAFVDQAGAVRLWRPS